jgi:hypothetical protein
LELKQLVWPEPRRINYVMLRIFLASGIYHILGFLTNESDLRNSIPVRLGHIMKLKASHWTGSGESQTPKIFKICLDFDSKEDKV